MMNFISRYFARTSFVSIRTSVYQNLAREMMDKGAGRTEKLTDKFDRWSARDRKRNDYVWIAYMTIAKRLKAGASLSKALKGFVPPEDQLVISAGEGTFRLGEVLQSLVAQSEVTKQVRGAMAGALVEPGVMFAGFLGTSAVFGSMIWPALERAFKPQYWDGWTVPMRTFQNWYSGWWGISILVMGTFFAIVYSSRPVWTGRGRQIMDAVPPYSSYKDLIAIQALVMLAALTRAGKKLSESFDIIGNNGSPYLKWHMRAMRKRLNQPNVTVDHVFSTGLFARGLIDVIADASQGREIDTVFDYVATNMMSDIVRSMAFRSKVINNGAMAFVFLLVGYASAVMVVGVQNASDKAIAAASSSRR